MELNRFAVGMASHVEENVQHFDYSRTTRDTLGGVEQLAEIDLAQPPRCGNVELFWNSARLRAQNERNCGDRPPIHKRLWRKALRRRLLMDPYPARPKSANKSRRRNSVWHNDLAQKRTTVIYIC
jgi:hypothetical protein